MRVLNRVLRALNLIFRRGVVRFWLIFGKFVLLISKNVRSILKIQKRFQKNIPFLTQRLKILNKLILGVEKSARVRKRRGEKTVREVRYNLEKKGQGRTLVRLNASIPARVLATTKKFDLEQDRLPIDSSFQPHFGKMPFGLWQLKFLKQNGLKKYHKIVDVGCGDLREGVPLINFLDSEKYIGLDQSQSAISQGLMSLTQQQINSKKPLFFMGYDFKLSNFIPNNDVDFAWANSVWTHLDLSVIITSLSEIYMILKPGGKFLVTFFDVEFEKIYQPGVYRKQNDQKKFVKEKKVNEKFTYLNRNPYHYPHKLLFQVAYKTGFKKAEVHSEKTPKTQSVLILTK